MNPLSPIVTVIQLSQPTLQGESSALKSFQKLLELSSKTNEIVDSAHSVDFLDTLKPLDNEALNEISREICSLDSEDKRLCCVGVLHKLLQHSTSVRTETDPIGFIMYSKIADIVLTILEPINNRNFLPRSSMLRLQIHALANNTSYPQVVGRAGTLLASLPDSVNPDPLERKGPLILKIPGRYFDDWGMDSPALPSIVITPQHSPISVREVDDPHERFTNMIISIGVDNVARENVWFTLLQDIARSVKPTTSTGALNNFIHIMQFSNNSELILLVVEMVRGFEHKGEALLPALDRLESRFPDSEISARATSTKAYILNEIVLNRTEGRLDTADPALAKDSILELDSLIRAVQAERYETEIALKYLLHFLGHGNILVRKSAATSLTAFFEEKGNIPDTSVLIKLVIGINPSAKKTLFTVVLADDRLGDIVSARIDTICELCDDSSFRKEMEHIIKLLEKRDLEGKSLSRLSAIKEDEFLGFAATAITVIQDRVSKNTQEVNLTLELNQKQKMQQILGEMKEFKTLIDAEFLSVKNDNSKLVALGLSLVELQAQLDLYESLIKKLCDSDENQFKILMADFVELTQAVGLVKSSVSISGDIFSISNGDVGLGFDDWHDKNHLMKYRLGDIREKGTVLISKILRDSQVA